MTIFNNVQWNPVNTVTNAMSQTNLAVLTGDRINEVFVCLFFLQENVWSFCRAAKKVAVIMKR